MCAISLISIELIGGTATRDTGHFRQGMETRVEVGTSHLEHILESIGYHAQA
jgi:hypothetical protein